jgi:beta-1,2-mannobiose phosphorylase / 1,2-beta-oligomannan phosphorylase
MIKVKKEGVLLRPTELPFENLSTFNPGIYQDGQYVHIFYRALSDKFISSIGYAKAKGPLEIVERWKKPFMEKRYKYESHGIEDPRIVKIGDIFYMTYVVHDGKNALIAYSHGKNLFKLKKGGVISPQISYDRIGKLLDVATLDDKYLFFKSYYKDMVAKDVMLWDKDGFFFPEKIKDKYAFIHRILPDIQLAYFDYFGELKKKNFWYHHIGHLHKRILIESKHNFESRNVGGGCPPIKTRWGWLLIYHGVEKMNQGRTYHAGAALLDLKNPLKVKARLPYPLFSPQEEWEMNGHVHKVVFPTGTAFFKDKIFIYYGSADTYTAVASVSFNSLIKELLKYKTS